jgi:hypothetical protein
MACLAAMILSAGALLAVQPRTWTFSQDGQMKTASGGLVSFKKNGRLEAAFVRTEMTNVVLLVRTGEYRTIPAKSLSDSDIVYVAKLTNSGSSETGPVRPRMAKPDPAAEKRIQASELKNHAASRRQLATMARETAAYLEAQADRMAARSVTVQFRAQTGIESANSLTNNSAALPALADLPRSTGAIDIEPDELPQEIARLRREAEDKRRKAANIEREAISLEQMAAELGPEEPEEAVKREGENVETLKR